MITDQQKQIIKQVLAPFEPRSIGIFGSFARNENTAESDLDILVDFKKRVSLFDIINLEEGLKEALHCKIDLLTKRSVHPSVKPYIDKETILI